MDHVIEKEAAEAELAGIVEFFEVDPEGKDWEDNRKRLLAAIQKGRLSLAIDAGRIELTLVQAIELENRQTVPSLSFKEPTAGDLKALDKYKENEGMAKTLHLVSKMTGQPIGVVERMVARDLSVVGAIASLFF
jgi:hypothetical protein